MLAKLPQLAKLAKLLLKLLLWLLLLCFFLLRLLVLLRRRDVSQELSELLSLYGAQERSQVREDARKSVCISRGLVSWVVGLSGRCWFAWLSAIGLLGLSDLLSLRLLLSCPCVLGFSLILGCWRSRSHPLASAHPGPATKEIGKHLDVWIAQNRVDLSCKVAPRGNSLARSRQPDHLVVHMDTSSLTSCTQVVVRADKALVARSNHWTVAAIADDAPMNLGTPCHSRVAFILCFVPQLHLELVDRASQGGPC